MSSIIGPPIAPSWSMPIALSRTASTACAVEYALVAVTSARVPKTPNALSASMLTGERTL